MKRRNITTDVCMQYCVAAQNLTQQNGVFKKLELKKLDLPGYNTITLAMQNKGFLQKLRRSTYRWDGPTDITPLVGEAVRRSYREYEIAHRLEKPKTNGAAPEAKPSRLEQIESRLAELESISSDSTNARLATLENAVQIIMDELK